MIELKAEDCLRIERGPAVEIGCLQGVVWITQEGELQDMFLGPGEWRTLTPRGAMLIMALEPAVLRVMDSAVAKPAGRRNAAVGMALVLEVPSQCCADARDCGAKGGHVGRLTRADGTQMDAGWNWRRARA